MTRSETSGSLLAPAARARARRPRPEERVGPEPCDREHRPVRVGGPADAHPARIRPAHVHRDELGHERCGCADVVLPARADRDRARRVPRPPQDRRAPPRARGADARAVPTSSREWVSRVWAEACCQPLRRGRRRDETVEILDVAQHWHDGRRTARSRLRASRPGRPPSARWHVSTCFAELSSSSLRNAASDGRSLGIERDPCEREVVSAAARVGAELRVVRVRVDEDHVEPVSVSRGDEEELVTRRELRSTIVVARRVSKCRSIARLSGRAPSSALKPFSIRKSTAASSHSTAHGRIRKPRRVEHLCELVLEQVAHHFASERAEDDDAIESVQELGSERPLDRLDHARGVERAALAGEAHARPGRDRGAQVRREDDHAVPQIDRAAVPVGQAAVVEHLEEDVPDVRVRLLELIQEQHREGLLAHRAINGAASCSARGVTEQALEALRSLVLAHVEAHEPVLGAKEESAEGFRDLGLAGPGRADEEENAEWASSDRSGRPSPARSGSTRQSTASG